MINALAFGDLDERITSQFSAILLGDLGTSQLRSLGSCRISPSCSLRISTISSFFSSSDIITLVVSKYFMDFNPKNGGHDLIQLLTHIFFKLVEKLLITQITCWCLVVLSPASPACPHQGHDTIPGIRVESPIMGLGWVGFGWVCVGLLEDTFAQKFLGMTGFFFLLRMNLPWIFRTPGVPVDC